MTHGGSVVRRRALALLAALVMAAAPSVGAAGSSGEPSVRASVAGPVERTVRFVVVQRSKVRLDIKASVSVRRLRVADVLPRRMTLHKGVLRGWAPKGRTVVRLRGISTLRGERGKRVQLKVVVVGRPQVARRGTALLTRAAGGAPGNGASYEPQVSEDGSTVVFQSEATNLVTPRLPRPAGFTSRVFAWDRRAGAELVSVAPDGSPLSGYASGVSDDGSRVLFRSGTTLYLRDRVASSTRELATVAEGGRVAALSADGNLATYTAGGRTWRLDLRTGSTTDLGVESFMAVSPNGRYLAVRDGARYFVWDSTTRTAVRELAVEEPEPWCTWTMTALTDDAQRGTVFAGCDHSTGSTLVEVASLSWLARGSTLDADADASWVVMANGRGRVEMQPVGGEVQLVSSQPARDSSGFSTARRTPSVAIADDGSTVAWSVKGGNVVRSAASAHDQIYFWTSGG